MSGLILFNKPCGVLSQFTSDGPHQTLADYIDQPGYYPAGRLDRDSEGLLLLTNDGKLQQKISDPKFKRGKTYLVQVEGCFSDSALKQLCAGLKLKDGMTLPAEARRISEPALWDRKPPVRYRKNIPTSWIELTIYEGRNRQVRRMTAATGFPTLRLVRSQVADWRLDGLASGDWKLLEV